MKINLVSHYTNQNNYSSSLLIDKLQSTSHQLVNATTKKQQFAKELDPNRIRRTVGGYSARGSPLPIPNREVKPRSADGTATGGRVSRRQLNTNNSGLGINYTRALLYFIPSTLSTPCL